jgi:uncharacterized protein (DUF433 family)
VADDAANPGVSGLMLEADEPVGRTLRRLPFGLDQGVYLQSQAALLAGIPYSTARRWLQLERGEGVSRGIADQSLVSFLDLISLRAVAALRRSGLGLAEIRHGAQYMRDRLQIEHPLASKDLLTDGVRVYFVQGAGLVSVDRGGQWAAQELVRTYLQDVRYKPMDGQRRLATSWEPRGVIIDPLVQRGAPCVAGSRVQIAVLKRYVDAGDSPERLAELFELKLEAVCTALQWYEGLAKRAA